MNLTDISNILSSIVSTIPNTMYLRATDIEANISADNIDLSGRTIVLFNNLPEVGQVVSRSGAVTREWPIELKVMQLALLDDNEVQSDTIRDACLAVADNIWDLVGINQDLPDSFEYRINFLGETKLYDKTLTGCKLLFTLNIQRTKYYCP